MSERILNKVSGWQYLRASSIFKNVSNKRHDGSLEVLSATQDKGIIPRSQVEIDIKYDPKSLTNYKKVEKANFVISLRSFQGGIEYSEYEGIVSPAYTVLSAIMPISHGYYRQFFKSTLYIKRLRVAVYGIRDGKQIGYADFGSLKIPYPPLEEQRRIAEILTAQDKIIALKERRLAEKRRQKTFLAQRLLTGKTRLPGFDGEWKTRRLKKIAQRIKRKNNIGNQNVLTISAQYGLINQSDFFNKVVASEDKSNYFLLKRDDFAYNKSYSNGYPFGAIKRLKKYDVGIVSPLYICFSLDGENVSRDFMEQYFESGFMNREIQAFAQEGARNHGLLNIAVDDFFNSKIFLPNCEEQQAIAEVLTCADREIEALQRDLELEKRKKKALMQLLLTGVVRVNSRRRSA